MKYEHYSIIKLGDSNNLLELIKAIEEHGNECYKAGIKEVLAFLEPYRIEIPSKVWQAKLKEWGL